MNIGMHPLARERGAVLIIVLVMVGIFMIIVTSLVGSSNINFRIAGNQQYRMEAKIAARNAMERYISNPANFTLPLPTSTQLIGTDFTGDDNPASETDDQNTMEVWASIAPPVCMRSRTIPISDLDISKPDEAQCLGSGSGQNTGILGSGGAAGNSWCARLNWDVNSVVNDATTGAKIDMHQGIFMLAVVGTSCP